MDNLLTDYINMNFTVFNILHLIVCHFSRLDSRNNLIFIKLCYMYMKITVKHCQLQTNSIFSFSSPSLHNTVPPSIQICHIYAWVPMIFQFLALSPCSPLHNSFSVLHIQMTHIVTLNKQHNTFQFGLCHAQYFGPSRVHAPASQQCGLYTRHYFLFCLPSLSLSGLSALSRLGL